MNQEPEADDELPSKTRRKNEMTALQKLGEKLATYTNSKLNKLPISAPLRVAINEFKRLPNSHGARRRQLQFIGRLMRDADHEALSLAISKLESPAPPDVGRTKTLDSLCSAIIDEGDARIQLLIEEHATLERQTLRQLYRDFRKADTAQQAQIRSRLLEYLDANLQR